MTAARDIALDVLLRFEKGHIYLRDALEEMFRQRPGLSPRDRAFCRDVVFGTVRRLNTVDWALGCFADSTVQKLSPPVRGLLRLGAFQILFGAFPDESQWHQ